MGKVAGAVGDSVYHVSAGNHGAQGSVTAGHAFGRNHDVRGHAPVLDRKVAPSAPHAGHNFVSNEQDAISPANGGNLLQVALRWHGRTQRGPAYRLQDEGGGLSLM